VNAVVCGKEQPAVEGDLTAGTTTGVVWANVGEHPRALGCPIADPGLAAVGAVRRAEEEQGICRDEVRGVVVRADVGVDELLGTRGRPVADPDRASVLVVTVRDKEDSVTHDGELFGI